MNDRDLLKKIVEDANNLVSSVSYCGATVTVKFDAYNRLMHTIVEAERHLHPTAPISRTVRSKP
jgi:hypothetical protein